MAAPTLGSCPGRCCGTSLYTACMDDLAPTPHEPYQSLLAAAVASHTAGDHKVAVILAQTAVELFTAKVLAGLYRQRQVEYLKGPFEHLLINYNIGNSKVSELYMALSGDEINQAPFWSRFTDHVQLRNNLVHDGQDATAVQAAASLAAVNQLIDHIQTFHNGQIS